MSGERKIRPGQTWRDTRQPIHLVRVKPTVFAGVIVEDRWTDIDRTYHGLRTIDPDTLCRCYRLIRSPASTPPDGGRDE